VNHLPVDSPEGVQDLRVGHHIHGVSRHTSKTLPAAGDDARADERFTAVAGGVSVMSSIRADSLHVGVVGDPADAAGFGSAFGAIERPIAVDAIPPAAVREGDVPDAADCLLVDDATAVDGVAVVTAAADAPPVAVLLGDAERYERETAALAAGAAATLPRRLVEDDPAVLADRLGSLADCEHDRTEREEREKYATLVEQSSDGVAVVQDGAFTFVNERFEEITGYDRETLIDGPFESVFAPECRDLVRERFCGRVGGDSPPDRYDVRVETARGDVRTLELAVSPISHGGDPATLANVRDVTERERRERVICGLQDATGRLQDAATPTDVAETAADAAIDVLDAAAAACWLHDAEDRRPAAAAGESAVRGLDVRLPPEAAECDAVGDVTADAPGDALPGDCLLLPLGDHGLLAAVPDRGSVVLDAARTLAETAETALDRIARTSALRASEREYEQIFDGVNDAISLHDPETGEMIDANESLCSLLGYDRETLLDRGAAAVSVSEAGYTDERGEEIIRSVVDSGESVQVEWQVETADGERRWLEINGTTAVIGGETRYLAIGRDVTERKRREREYEQIFNGVTDVVTVFDPETHELVAVNDRACELTGYDRETLLGREIGFASATDEGYTDERAAAVIDEVLATGEDRDLEWALETADDEIRWLELTATPAIVNGRERLLTISRDVTDRRRTERRLRAILDRIDEAVFLAPVAELDRTSPNPDFTSSGYEDIWGQPLDRVHERYPDGFFGTLHDDDLAGYRTFVERIRREVEAGEAADSYAREYRIERPSGEIRWVHSDFYPTEWADGPPRIVIVSRDVTERKARERRMASFNAATEDLATADRPVAAARTAVDAAAETLDLPAVGAFLYDDEAGVLRPEVLAGRVPDGLRNRVVGPGDGPLWDAFANGAVVTPAGEEAPDLTDCRALALGNHGVLLVGSPDGTFDSDTIQATHVLAATLEAALNHLRGQRRLAAQEERLRTQTARAERLDRVARLAQQVEAAITDASGASEVERAVCDRLAGTGPYERAWIGGVEVGADRLTPRVVVGGSSASVEAADLTTTAAGPDPHPAVCAWRTDDVHVADSLVADGATGDWRRHALSEGVQSVCAVPLSYDGITHGVLTVTASGPNAFGERAREVLAQLGTSVGYALAAIQRRRTLESDETVELVFRDEGEVDVGVARAARAADCRVRHERTVARDGDVSVFFTFEGPASDAAAVAARTLPGEASVVTDDPDSTLVEVRTDSWFGSPLAAYGAVLRRVTATPTETTVVVEVSTQADVRSFVDRVRELAPGLDLVAKRQHRRQTRTPGELRDRVAERLTDRQREALTTALEAGYFEWPRENDGRAVAERLDITQPTLNKHLRVAERKTFELLFDPS
jgi:PAS domain S-box-containing protein